MSSDSIHWMQYAIGEAHRAPQQGRRVGAVLVSDHGQLMCSAFEGEMHLASWVRTLRRKVRELAIASAHSVYLTVNTVSADGSFDLTQLLNAVQVGTVYIGMPDPALTSYLDGDPAIERGPVHRFPDDLQREIMEQNRGLYAACGQSIRCNPHYSTHRISEAVCAGLRAEGFALSRRDVTANRERSALVSLIRHRHGVAHASADRAVGAALARAFDAKYGAYDYAYDARAANVRWTDDFMAVYKTASARPLSAVNILNVGVGAGHEAAALFSDCPQITFADIAESGLAAISERSPLPKTLVSSAEDLSALPADTFDLYVSLRTYNSSFFDTSAAAHEARRVLKPGAVIIISVANGFLYTQRGFVVPGLIIPGTEFVDLYRGINIANLIGTQLDAAGFRDVRMFPTSTEIYLSAIAA
ncbi:methyltransferase domain-containing protein [Streptomyces sp. NPDC007172]|uniref:methyltransferase domain-containing protein n=1 Tax=Streptomyces sp. NPDC007172 TaxID=3364776 RepID=UPI00367FD97A